ncbi:sugar transferase [candidate division KSB1 bacterium]|nr:sugar transferase [candidate division KSB1 bacterium]
MAQVNEHSIWMRLFQQIADILMTVISFVTAFAVRSQIRTVYFFGSAQSVDSFANILIIVVPVWWFFLDIQKAYSEAGRVSLRDEFNLVVRTALFGTLTLLAIAYILRLESPPRSTIILFVVINVALLFLNRIFFHNVREYLRAKGEFAKTILIVGSGDKAQRFLNALSEHAEWGIDLVGFVELDRNKIGKEVMGAKILGGPEHLPEILHSYPIHEVVFAVPTRMLADCTDMLALCEQEGVRAVILSNFFSSLVAMVDAEVQYDQPVLIYSTNRHREWQLLVKRLIDLAVSLVLLVLLAPLLAVVAMLIKFGDGGPVFYTWKVVGQNKKNFTGYKFRTMVVNADLLKEKLLAQNEMKGIAFKMSKDPRITRVGHFLRKFSLDELPQLWSVLKGDMSVVGPRPPLETELKRFESWHRRKLSVKPGLTCLWQVSGRSTITDFDEWVRLDLAYIDNWSLWLDFKILLKTIPVVLTGRGAH